MCCFRKDTCDVVWSEEGCEGSCFLLAVGTRFQQEQQCGGLQLLGLQVCFFFLTEARPASCAVSVRCAQQLAPGVVLLPWCVCAAVQLQGTLPRAIFQAVSPHERLSQRLVSYLLSCPAYQFLTHGFVQYIFRSSASASSNLSVGRVVVRLVLW